MNKQEFLKTLWNRLSELPNEDVERSLDYYAEMIDDRVESGMTEDEAVEAIGGVEEAAAQILADVPEGPRKSTGNPKWAEADVAGSGESPYLNSNDFTASSYQAPGSNSGSYSGSSSYAAQGTGYYAGSGREKKSHSGIFWLFVILGFPIWFPLLITAGVLVFTAFVLVWTFTFVYYVIAGSFAVSGVAGIFILIRYVFSGDIAVGLFYAGCGFVLAGISIFMFLVSGPVLRLAAKACRAIWRGITGLFGRRDRV